LKENTRLAHDPQRTSERARALARAFVGITALTYGLIVLGALVRAHGAGLACPDWPLCFGNVIPEFDLKVAFEWSHRAAAGTISLLFLGTSIVVLRDPAIGPPLRGLLLTGAVVLAVQIVFGALTVWQLLASWTVTSHLLIGNAFALCLAFAARALFALAAPREQQPRATPGIRLALTFAAGLLVLQMGLGGLVSSGYAGLACSEWPTCNGGVFFPSFEGALGTHLLHRLGAYALAGTLLTCAWLARDASGLRGLLGLAAALVLAQTGVGVANVLLRLPVEVTGLHSALAAGLVLTVALALAEAWRAGLPRARGEQHWGQHA
jgi:cytochrome c oxidase assembly protein subunit 15